VHGAHAEFGRVEVGAQRPGVGPDVVQLNGAVAEAPDGLEHLRASGRELVPDAVELQGRWIARQIAATFPLGDRLNAR